MPPIEWLPIYSVHVRVIDAQHQRFVGIINQLDEAIRLGRIREELDVIFQELIEYARMHFATEEMYFDRFGYEGAPAHKAAHAKLAAELRDLKLRHGANENVLSRDLAEFLFDWFTEHTVHMDKGYTKCFNEHGLT